MYMHTSSDADSRIIESAIVPSRTIEKERRIEESPARLSKTSRVLCPSCRSFMLRPQASMHGRLLTATLLCCTFYMCKTNVGAPMSRPKWSDVHLLIPPPALGTLYRSYSHNNSNVASGPSTCMVSKNKTDLFILNVITWMAVRTGPTWTVHILCGKSLQAQ